jgi:tRNA U34 5-methylaminomethyl-2-thiouridine-forming methyltransferase MnmC
MPSPRKTFSIENHSLAVQITDDQSRTLVNPDSNVAYHSASGAYTETRHVYLNNSGVADRLSSGVKTYVLEIGLGTGMGMLLTLDTALAAGAGLRYTAVENHWLAADVLRLLNLGDHVADASIATRFLEWREAVGEQPRGGVFRWRVGPEHCIGVYHQDATLWVRDAKSTYDAIYFDPFAPDANPQLWQPAFLSRLHGLLNDDGRLVTYCVSRAVRNAFTMVGFDVARVPGPVGGKREVMIATKHVET